MATAASTSTLLDFVGRMLGGLGVFLLFCTTNVFAGQATLTWDTSPGPDLKGYRLYYGQASGISSGQYASNVDVGLGNQTTTEAACTVATNGAVTCKKLNLQDGTPYYFAVKAYNSAGTESVFSNEVNKIADSATAPPMASFSASSTPAAPLQWTFTNTSTGAVTKRCWKFGAVAVGGDTCESTALNPSYAYTQAGTYTVTLIASNSMGSTTASRTITVNPPATALGASLAANKTTGQVPLDVTFSGAWTGAATKWSISGTSPFTGKSGSISTGTTQPVTAMQTYSAPGTYTVTFTVTDASGTSKSAQQTIKVTTTAPTANFTASATSTAPLTVQFTDTSTPVKAITEWFWNFGESTSTSNTSTLQYPAHTYSKAGTYTVSLTARNSAGSNTKTGSVTVSAASASTSGLVAAYNFEEASDATVVDASGKGNHGSIACNKAVNSSCSAAARTTSGKFGRALSFDGMDDWVTVNDSAILDLTNRMTLEAWVSPTATMSSWRGVLLKEQTGGLVYGLYANSDSNQPVSSINVGGGDQNLAGGSAIAVNSWVHLAATYDGVTQRLYVNGSQVASRAQTGNMTVSGGALRVGGNSVWSEYFKGRIDEIRIYNRALTATEIKTDMNTAITVSSTPILLVGDDPKAGTQATTDTISKGTAKAFLKKADKTGRVTSLSVNVVSGSTAFDVGLYTNNNGRPGTLLARGVQSVPKVGKNTVPLSATAITAGTTYWIAILSPSGSLQVSDRVGGGTQPSETGPTTTNATLPTTWWTGGTPSYDGPLAGFGAGY